MSGGGDIVAGGAFYINVRIRDLQKQLGDIAKYDAATQDKLRAAVQTSTKNTMLGAKRRVRSITGNLIKKIGMTYDPKTNSGSVYAKAHYSHFVEFGHKGAHEVPKNKKALAIDGEPRSKADVPNVAPHPFLTPAWQDEKPNFLKSVKDAIEK